MLRLFIFVILIFNAATHPGTDPAIIFNIQAERLNGQSVLTCDHSMDRVAHQLSTYTVYEGHEFTIVTKYNASINHILCNELNNEHFYLEPLIHFKIKLVTTFMAYKATGTRWNCTILTHLDNAVIQPVVQYKYHNYSAAYCYMGIHVRLKVAPQMILVNNVVLPANRINLSQKDVDLIAEYQYADGDEVNVTCMNTWDHKVLTMEYNMAGRKSDESIMNELSSSKMIGFVTKLHSGHNNSYMICTQTAKRDYTKVMVKFVMRTNFVFNNIVSLVINGMFIRPQIVNPTSNQYRIDYKYVSNQLIEVMCKVKRTDVKLMLLDGDSDKGTYKSELFYKENRMSIRRFSLSSKDRQLECAADYLNGTSAETVDIYFTEGIFPVELYPLHMKFSRDSGIEIELYNAFKLNVILYEFVEEGLSLACGQLSLPVPPGPILYLQLGSERKCNIKCYVSKTFERTRQNENNAIACYLKEKLNTTDSGTLEVVHREIRVIFHERVLNITTTSTTTSSTTPTNTSTIPTTTTKNTASNLLSSETPTYSSNNDTLLYSLSGVGVVVLVIILVVLYYTILKKRFCVRSGAPIPAPRIDLASAYYENQLAVFKPINEREAAEMAENHYEEID